MIRFTRAGIEINSELFALFLTAIASGVLAAGASLLLIGRLSPEFVAGAVISCLLGWAWQGRRDASR